MLNNKLKKIIAFTSVLTWVGFNAQAQELQEIQEQVQEVKVESTTPPEKTVRKISPSPEAAEIAAINERVAVMAARLAELEMQAKIAETTSKINQTTAGDTALDNLNQIHDNFIPSVLEISGIDGKIWAILNVTGGTQVVHVGDVASGWKVTSIRSDSVTVNKKGKVVNLSFGKSAVQTTQQNFPGGMNNVVNPRIN